MPSVTLSIFKAYGARTNRQWVNTYELSLRDGLNTSNADPQLFMSAAQAIYAAERHLHWETVYFHRWVLSSWEPDSTPYDPMALVTVPVGEQGLRALGGGPEAVLLDLRQVLMIGRATPTGRPGRLFYRGCLSELDVEFNAGYPRIAPGAGGDPIRAAFAAYRTALAPVLPSGNNVAQLTLINGVLVKTAVPANTVPPTTRIKRTYVAPFTVRPVTDVVLSGVTSKQQGNRYFDRAA